ncbi:N-acetyltransferase [Nocardia sp. NBC_00565]|uniref:GNAT family N-acetyltransferase n=1 Tax=Nocardia sp. NBC_00565 TaxID=2975993 RepID=UPI002E81950A|nr:GNAT family N-acetyltransferase [Nocardia sp. NBC_00565]WUC03081.1 N-acetyltransferase [Nocardia sp. NBC_00565]
MTTRLEHNVADTRFEIYIDDTLAGYADYAERDDAPPTHPVGSADYRPRRVRDFHHTMTFPEFRGHGVAAQVVAYALNDSRAEGFAIIPTCWYVEKYIVEHGEYADLVA